MAATIAMSALVSGCIGPSTKLGIVDVGSTPAPIVREAWSIQSTESVPPGAQIVGVLEGTSCKNKIWDPDPTNEKALEQLQLKAREVGAKGVANVTYSSGGTSFITNCWSHITASGTAYR
jgi:hypothetical protein